MIELIKEFTITALIITFFIILLSIADIQTKYIIITSYAFGILYIGIRIKKIAKI